MIDYPIVTIGRVAYCHDSDAETRQSSVIDPKLKQLKNYQESAVYETELNTNKADCPKNNTKSSLKYFLQKSHLRNETTGKQGDLKYRKCQSKVRPLVRLRLSKLKRS
jgi:hypothetical protein